MSENVHVKLLLLEDWRCDQHRWINQGVKMLPQKNPCVRKSCFIVDTPNGPSKDFGKHAYQLISSKTFTLIYYLGNENVVIPFFHRNAKSDLSASFVRTCPSTLKIMKSQCIHNTASVVYNKEISSVDCLPEFVPTQKPRDMKISICIVPKFQKMTSIICMKLHTT